MAAYEFRSIADVELKDQPVDSTTVIIEQDGVLARVPKDKVGVTSYNDLKDKPDYAALEVAEAEGEVSNVLVECDGTLKRAPKNYVGATSYEKLEGKPGDIITIEWDGNTEGRDSFSEGEVTYYKVSDLIPTKEDLYNGIIELNDGTLINIIPNSSGILFEGDGVISIGPILIVSDADLVSETIETTVPSTGIYSIIYNGNYCTCLEYTKKIPVESMPNTIQTAIIKDSNYDNALTGVSAAIEAITFSCINMTFDEAWGILTSGNALNVILMAGSAPGMLSSIIIEMDLSNTVIIITFIDGKIYWTSSGISTTDPTATES